MRILFADSNHPVLHETLQAAGFVCDLYWDRPAEELEALLPEYDGLVIRSRFRLSKELLEKCSRLKCIGRVGAGLENIDVDYANRAGIVCLSAPEGNRDALGEHALGMLLMLLNHLKKADAEVRQGIWLRAGNRGTEIKGKTIALIGYGHMGSAFARKLSGFECRILAYDKYKTGFTDELVQECGMAQIFEEADIVSIHLPLTSETRYLVNSAWLSAFRKNIYLINTARGPCVNTADLVEALRSGKVLGTCLDVLEYEATSFEKIDTSPAPLQYLIHSDKVILSPHIAGWTHESNYKLSKTIADKMATVFKVGL